MATYQIPQILPPPPYNRIRSSSLPVGDFRLSTNQTCWPVQADMERQIMAGEEANLVVTARRQERLSELETAVKKVGGKVVSLGGDAKEEEIARRAVDLAIKTFGSLDILVNNVGVGNYKNLIDTSAEENDEMMNSNMRSTFLFTRHAVRVMIKQGLGTILMISSMAGVYRFGGEAVYCATKFAQALDKELRPHGTIRER